jgi:HAMP domain-containing protein
MFEVVLLILVAIFAYALGWRVATRRYERAEEIAQELRAGVLKHWPPPNLPPTSAVTKQVATQPLPPKFTNAVPRFVVVGENASGREGK